MTADPEPNAYRRKVLSPKTLARREQPRGRLPIEVGVRLREARSRAGLSQQELAERTAEVAIALQQWRTVRYLRWAADGVTQRTISYLELGQRAPSIRTARLLSDALALSDGDPLRRDLLRNASKARKLERRAKAATQTNGVVRLANRLLGGAVRAVANEVDDRRAAARADREAARRTRKGGWPSRHPVVARRASRRRRP